MTTCGEIGFGKMNKKLIIVADADAIIAQTIIDDAHHNSVSQILKKLARQNAQILYPITAIAEATTYIQRILGKKSVAYTLTKTFAETKNQVLPVDLKTLKLALDYFSPTSSKKNTLFDCIVAALAKENQADAIFSFDKFYKSKGFTLVGDLLMKR